MAGEDCRRTRHDKIFVACRSDSPDPAMVDGKEGMFEAQVAQLIQAAEAGRPEDIRRLLNEIVSDQNAMEPGADGQRELYAPRLLVPPE